MGGWSVKDIGSQQGKVAIVTGANSGIGYFTALALGRAGADVTLACRDPARGPQALAKLRAEAPEATFRLEPLDLANLASVRGFANAFVASGRQLDLLVNNAGVMALPSRELTADGFERQFGTNHLGPFALTGLLLPALRQSKAPRVVVVSSAVADFARIELDNLQSEKRYAPMRTYGQTKLSNLLFMLGLNARAPWLKAVAAHPGGSETELQRHGLLNKLAMKVIGQSASEGALPSLRAATEDVPAGTYFGPRGLMHLRGAPVVVKPPKRALDAGVATQLWEASERLTAVTYPAA